jgi:hypothetical protein
MTTTTTPYLNDSLTKVSMMASASAIALPSGLAEALGHMQRAVACPEDVRAKVAALKVPAEEVSGTRGFTTNWRGPPAGGGHPAAGGGGRWGGGGGERSGYPQGERSGYPQGERSGGGSWGDRRPNQQRGGWNNGGGSYRHHQQHDAPPPQQFRGPPPTRRPFAGADRPRFGNKARTDATVEDRMLDRIRDKMNKFSPMTYDATKGWLTQLLDSGETDFLSGFIELVFEKAASEATFTTLYARLLTELRAAFPHINVELRRIFESFLSVFVEAAEEPDVASAEYAAYLTLRERRKFRRGYATFLAEIAKLGVLTSADIHNTCDVVLTGLEAARVAPDQQQLCEEYADCLGSLLKGCKDLIRGGIGPTVSRIMAAKERAGASSLSSKARFALLDLEELFA